MGKVSHTDVQIYLKTSLMINMKFIQTF